MKQLTTEQQEELQALLGSITGQEPAITHQINYWLIELKPKRVRRNKSEDSSKELDNTPL